MSNEELQLEFRRIHKLYFPDWEDGSNWQICEYGGKGFCDRRSMIIKVGDPSEIYSLPVLIIHEVAHAVTTDEHGDEWFRRMRKVEMRAAEVGDHQLANELQSHIAWVASPEAYNVAPEEVYAEIGAAVLDDPTAPFEKIVGWLAESYGQDLHSFLQVFPQAREVYDQAYRPQARCGD